MESLSDKSFIMFLTLNHQKLKVYSVSRTFVMECYKLTRQLPPEERFGMVSQVRRAALSVHLNIAEGASRKLEVERKRYYEIARGPVIEIDAALDIAESLDYMKGYNSEPLGGSMVECFKMLSGMLNNNSLFTIDYSPCTTT